MTVKDQVISMIRRLPDDAAMRDIEEELALLTAIDAAEKDIAENRLVSNEEMEQRVAQWTES